MATDKYSVTINKPIEMVFNYVTTPAYWPICRDSPNRSIWWTS